MTEALGWYDEEQLKARLVRGEPTFAELIYGRPGDTQTINSLLDAVYRQRGNHVGRG